MPTDLTSLLDHARDNFIYHAGQRLTSIRYYFATYAIFVAAYFGTFVRDAQIPSYARPGICGVAIIVTLAFWGLDKRNAELVEIDEKAVGEIEDHLAAEHSLKRFRLAHNWEAADKRIIKGPCRQKVIKYSFIIKATMIAFMSVSIFALFHAIWAALQSPVMAVYNFG